MALKINTMVKYVFFLMAFFVVNNLFSQEKSITTEFSQDGSLYKNFKDFETVLAEFKTGEICMVIDYFGKDTYKIKYNERIGFVDSQYLIINEEMMDLFYAYQEKESKKTIEAEKKRKDEVEQIENESEEKKQQLALQELEKKKAFEIIEQKKQDSMAKIKIPNKNKDIEKEITVLSTIDATTTCDYAMNEFDPINKVKLIRTEPANMAKNLTAELFKRGKSNYIFFNLFEDLGCASYLPNNRSSAKVTLENNKTITFYHSWDMYCGEFIFKASLSNLQMAMLKKSPIKAVKFHGTESSKDLTTIIYKTFFIDKLHCIE